MLSVSTAGMLIRRDVFEQLGGFDRRLPLMRDDVDLCWRAQAAGHRVLIAPDAVVRHAEAASRERRPVDCVGPHRRLPAQGRQGRRRLHPAGQHPHGRCCPGCCCGSSSAPCCAPSPTSSARCPDRPLDEIRGLLGTLLRPERIIAGRRRRGRPTVDEDELRPLFPPPGATVRATVEQVASNLVGRSDPEAVLGPAGTAAPSSPGPATTTPTSWRSSSSPGSSASPASPARCSSSSLLLVSLVACRDLLGGGALAGGALLPAPAGRLRPVGALRRRLAPGRHRRHRSPRRPTSPSSPTLATLLLGSHRPRPHPAAGLLGAAGRLHRLLRLPAARRVAAAARLGDRRLRLPARRHRRARRRPRRHRRPGRPAAADRPRGRRGRRPRARSGGARQLARHLGVRAAADHHHRVHARSCGPSPLVLGLALARPCAGGELAAVRPALPGPARHPAAGPRPLVADAAAPVRLLRRGRPATTAPATASAPRPARRSAPAAPARSAGCC